MRPLPSLLGAACLYLSTAAASANGSDECAAQPWDSYYNATGSVSVPGPRVNASEPETTWTWSRFVSDWEHDGEATTIYQVVGLDTLPKLNLSDPSIPYTSYVIALVTMTNPSPHDDGTCSSVLGPGCVQSLNSSLSSYASRYSGTDLTRSGSGLLDDLVQSLNDLLQASPCPRPSDTGSMETQFIPQTPLPNSTYNADCGAGYGANLTVTKGLEFSFAFYGGTQEGIVTAPYDRAVTGHIPLVIVTLLKEGASGPSGWVDVQIICLPANVTQPGSRTYAQALQAVGAAPAGPRSGISALLIAALTLVMLSYF